LPTWPNAGCDRRPALTEALAGRFSDHHAFLARLRLDLLDRHTQATTT
jgi:hypothetical protein